MESKYKITFILFAIGTVLTVIGALFRIMHWPFGTLILNVGVLTEFASVLSLIIALVKKDK